MNSAKLLRSIVRLAKRVTKRPLEVHDTRRPHFFCDLAQPDDADGWDSSRLDGSCDQSHGLITDASGRGEQHRVHTLLFEPPGNLWSGCVQQCLDVRRLDMAHKAVAGG